MPQAYPPHRPFPERISHASAHCRSDFERLVDTHEIVVHRMERHGAGVILDLL